MSHATLATQARASLQLSGLSAISDSSPSVSLASITVALPHTDDSPLDGLATAD